MKRLTNKLRPAGGFSHLLHILLTLTLPLLLFVLVRIDLAQIAIALVFLSKWRTFAVQPRHWLAHLRANAADLVVGVATIIFMVNTISLSLQLAWVAVYSAWLLLIKPSSSLFGIAFQAFAAFVMGIMAVFTAWGASPTLTLMLASWVVGFVTARHFFTGFDESYGRFLAHAWALFSASLVWLLSHWLLFYGAVSQPALLLTVLSFGLAAIYYLEKTDRLSKLLRRQLIFIMVSIVVIVLVFSDWSDRTI